MKRIYYSSVVAIACSILAIGSAVGQQKISLTMEQSIEIGLANNKSLHSSLMKVEAADAKSSEMNAARLPSVKLGASYTRLSDVPPSQLVIPKDFLGPNFPPRTITSELSPVAFNNYNMRLSLQQPLFTGFRLQGSSNAAAYAAEATSNDYKKDKTELIYNISNAYWSLYKTSEFNKVIDQNVEQIRAHLKDVQNLAAQ